MESTQIELGRIVQEKSTTTVLAGQKERFVPLVSRERRQKQQRKCPNRHLYAHSQTANN